MTQDAKNKERDTSAAMRIIPTVSGKCVLGRFDTYFAGLGCEIPELDGQNPPSRSSLKC